MRAAIVFLGLSLSACVTQQESVFDSNPSEEDALKARVELARSYIGEGNWEDAKRNLKLAQEIDPKSPEVAEAFALVYERTGEYELAEESFKRALSLQRDFSRARNNYAAFLYSQGAQAISRGRTEEGQQRMQQAEEQLIIVVRDTLYDARPRAFINLGLVQVQLGKDDEAREAFSRALAMDRGNNLALLELAHIEYRAGNYTQSDRYLENYRRFRRQQSARALWLGIRVARQLEDRDAEASYTLALRNLYPQSAEYRAYQQAVENGEL
ncbi:MAG: type IV pilus biogenesis/stability protein PilW [Halieaceae bacterium]|nr:type IV pilus biogenesis/stability protein PilW [Halieaceae bacterium]